MNKKQDWRTSEKSNRDESRQNDSQSMKNSSSKNAGGKKPAAEGTDAQTQGTRVGQRSTENRHGSLTR